jgi:NAD(P)-dependent dehydrogenase (short-subunit alcohol dehydrogenase family)
MYFCFSLFLFIFWFIYSKQKITALINNAGVAGCPYSKTKDGFELQMGTNHFGHFYLTKLLLPRLNSSRIVNVSSLGHFIWKVPCDASHYAQMYNPNTYNRWSAYSLSKSANIIFTRELQRRYSITHHIRAYSLHPGGVSTQLDRHIDISNLMRAAIKPIRCLFFKTPLEGAQTNLYCALSDEAQPGAYHADCHPTPVLNEYVENDEVARDWWDYSEKIINEKLANIKDK